MRVDAVVHPLTTEPEGRVVGTSDGILASDAITSDRGSGRPIRADEVALRIDYDSRRQTKILATGVEHAPAGGCKGHVIDKGINAVAALDRVPKWGVASGLDRGAIILRSRD
jgi:hypothetical protein